MREASLHQRVKEPRAVNKMTIAMKALGYIASVALVALLVITGEPALCVVPFVVALSVVLCTATVSDKP